MLIAIILFMFIVFFCYVICLKTNSGRQVALDSYKKTYIAHRGLFDNLKNCPENSLKAFECAVRQGYGIELDVQMTKDKKLVVFHDDSLKRMCNIEKKISECTYEEIASYHLLESSQIVPLFSEVLSVIDGKVPVIIEVKTDSDYLELCEKVSEELNKYDGEYCIESFHPLVVAWFRINHPHIIRGQLSTHYRKDKINRNCIESFLLTNLLFNFYTRPDFIAYNHNYKNQFSYKLCKFFYKPINVAWTIRNKKELEEANNDFDIIIFDSFIPDRNIV